MAGFEPGKFFYRSIEINQFYQRVTYSCPPAQCPRRLQDKWYIYQNIFETVLGFFNKPVITGKISMIAEKENRSIIIHTTFFKRIQNKAGQIIYFTAHSKIYRTEFGIFCFRPVVQTVEFMQSLFYFRFTLIIVRRTYSGRNSVSINTAEKRFTDLVYGMRKHQR